MMSAMESKFRQLINMKEIPASSASVAPPWTELPSDLTANILQRLGIVEILGSVQKVCAIWLKVCKNPDMWRMIKIEYPNDMVHTIWPLWELDMMFRRAVDRSQGQLIDLTIDQYNRDDELLNYIADRSSQLRRLSLAVDRYDISRTDLTEAVKQFPELEELHFLTPFAIYAADLQTIGISCPMLKSFTFNRGRGRGRRRLPEIDYALAIPKNMPKLSHLRLFAYDLNNEGLQTILDGCPHLDSLDLRRCFGVDLVGELGKRCCEQIKYLRHPSDSVDDYDYVFDNASDFSDDDDLSYLCANDYDN